MSFTHLQRALAWGAFALVFLLLVILCWRQIDIADFWWQYKTGKLIAESGIPKKDVFTYPSYGQPWIEMRWLFCLGEAWIVDNLGFFALNIIKTIVIGAAFLISLGAGKGLGKPLVAGPIMAVAVVAASHRFVIRPEILTFLFFSLYLLALSRWRSNGGRLVFCLPLLQVVWTNSHTLFLLGPIVISQLWIVLAFQVWRKQAGALQLKQLSTVLVLTCLACFLNPYALEGVLFPVRLFMQTQGTVFKDAIGELRSPFEFNHLLGTQAFYLLIGLSVVSTLVARKRADPLWVLLALSQLFLALSSIRNLPLFALAAIPLNLSNIEAFSRKPNGKSLVIASLGMGMATSVAAIFLTWATVTNRLTLREGDRRYFGSGPSPNSYPRESSSFLRERGFTGKIFNTLAEGSYLLAQDFKVYFDPRLEVHQTGIFEEGLAAVSDPVKFEKLAQQYGIGVAVVDTQSAFPASILRSRAWKLAFFDSESAVYARSDLAVTWPNLNFEQRLHDTRAEMKSWPKAAQIQTSEEIGGFLVAVEKYELAQTWANWAVELSPDRWRGYALLGRCLQQTGQPASAIDAYRSAIERGATIIGPWKELAACQMSLNDLENAAETAAEATDRFPQDANSWATRGVVELRNNSPDLALKWLEKASQLAPQDLLIAGLKGTCLEQLGRDDDAAVVLSHAHDLAPKNFEINIELAMVYHRLHRNGLAKRHLEMARQVLPSNPLIKQVERQWAGSHDP